MNLPDSTAVLSVPSPRQTDIPAEPAAIAEPAPRRPAEQPRFRGFSVRPEALGAWLILLVAGLWCRPLTPVDETRAVSVAWEMWLRGDFLVPHLNGETYSHKPPLLQWLIQLGWWVFGVNEWSPRVTAPLFGLAGLFLTAALGRNLWPEMPEIARRAPIVLLAFLLWAVWGTVTVYDMLSACFAVLGLLGIVRAAAGIRLGFPLLGLALGGGLLSKGPIILVLVLPAGLLAPWWMAQAPLTGWGRWYGGLFGALLLGAAIALMWAIPAAARGGEGYRNAIFWGQSAGRIANSFAHRRPFWWYLAAAPVLFLPWTLWPPLWRAARSVVTDWGLRLCLLHGAAVLCILSMISGKQPHYLIPLFPVAALVVTRLLAAKPNDARRSDGWILGGILSLFGLVLAVWPLLPVGEASGHRSHWMEIADQSPVLAGWLILGGGLLLLKMPGRPDSALLAVCAAMLALLLGSHLTFRAVEAPLHDLKPIAERIGERQRAGAPIAHFRKYDGDYQFLGRLSAPLAELKSADELRPWLMAHPNGYVVARSPNKLHLDFAGADFVQNYRRSRQVALWPAAVLLRQPELQTSLLE